MLHIVICPKCGQPFEIEKIEKHVIDCRGKASPKGTAEFSDPGTSNASGASA